jgi:glycosyltransferase involved in cell wall biosynthesis
MTVTRVKTDTVGNLRLRGTQGLRVLSVLPSDVGKIHGGGERFAFELHRALARASPDWICGGLAAASEHLPSTPPDWVFVDVSRSLGVYEAGDALGSPQVIRRIRQFNPDVVICHQWRTRATSVCRVLQVVARRRIIVAIDHGGGGRLGAKLSSLWLPRVAVAAHQSAYASRVSPIKASGELFIGGGVDTSRFTPKPKSSRTIDFLMVARFLPHKGQLRLLRALPSGATAMLVGRRETDTGDYWQAVIDAARVRGVPVALDVSDDKLGHLYRSAKFTIQAPPPYRNNNEAPPELLGMSLLEAMACGSIPIAPSEGPAHQFITPMLTGLLYQNTDDGFRHIIDYAYAMLPQACADINAHAIATARDWSWTCAAQRLAAYLRSRINTGTPVRQVLG